MIVDTGLHYTGMKRDEAIKLFADSAWDDSDITRKEVSDIIATVGIKPVLKSYPGKFD